jgi:protein involved in polysaccharide export with SLBB domain
LADDNTIEAANERGLVSQKGCRKMAKPGRRAQLGATTRPGKLHFVLLLLAWLSAGCAMGGKQVDQAMEADKPSAAARHVSTASRYLVSCPDIIEVHLPGQADPIRRCPIGPEGRIELGALGSLRVEGLTTADIAQRVAELVGLPADQVRVRVVGYHSQQVYLFGEVSGLQRAVAYQGEETIADLLQRAGGITPGAAPAKVHVVRPRVTEGKSPLIYHVDLQAIVMAKDTSTNLRIQPFDQVYVSETHRSSLHKCIPPLIRPLYQAFCGLERIKK